MVNDKTEKLAWSIITAAILSLHSFWILNLLKEAFAPIKRVFNFYSPVGPLLGLYLAALFIGVVGYAVTYFNIKTPSKSLEKKLLWLYVGSIIVFFLMVFPPIFEPVVHFINGK